MRGDAMQAELLLRKIFLTKFKAPSNTNEERWT
jgi:hypothetical protein